ncbi:MAG: hypothetical protein RL120_09065 [Gammaproteobacteria bacterium]
MSRPSQTQYGFTLIEVIVIGLVMAALAGLALTALYQTKTTTGTFTTAPATVPAGGSANFTFNMSESFIGRTTPISGRTITFRVEPAGILTVTPASGATNASGDFTVAVGSPNIEYVYGGNIWATDTVSGAVEGPIHFDVR